MLLVIWTTGLQVLRFYVQNHKKQPLFNGYIRRQECKSETASLRK